MEFQKTLLTNILGMVGGTSEPGGFSWVMPTQAQGPARWPKFLKICKIQIWSKMHPEVQKSTLIMIFDNLAAGFSVNILSYLKKLLVIFFRIPKSTSEIFPVSYLPGMLMGNLKYLHTYFRQKKKKNTL